MRKIYLDTCCIIYLLEDIPEFSLSMRNYITKNKDVILCVSPLVRLELLIKPLKEANQEIIDDYTDFIAAQQWLPINDTIFEQASNLRAQHLLKTPDAIHLATANYHGCNEFWTNDNRLKKVVGEMAVNIFQENINDRI